MPGAATAADHRRRAATRCLVPFAAAVLSGRNVSPALAPAPVGGRDALAREVVDALVEVIRRGVLRWLFETCGFWRMRVALPGRSEPAVARAWEIPWSGLRFSAVAIDAVRCAYDLCVGSPMSAPDRSRAAEELGQLRPSLGGDILLWHVLGLRLAARERSDAAWDPPWIDPLTALARCRSGEDHAALGGLLATDIGPVLPWLFRHVAVGRWLPDETERWWRASFGDGCRARCVALDGWAEAARSGGRWDLLDGPMRYFHGLVRRLDTADGWIARFAAMTQGSSMRERSELGRALGELLDRAGVAVRAYQAGRHTHPVDREAPMQVLMALYRELCFDGVAADLERISAAVRPRLG